MKGMKLAFVGCLRSGKDTAADYFVKNHDFKAFSFGSGIADVIHRYFPDAFEEGKPRKHYQVIGQAFRELNPDIWVEMLEEKLKEDWAENPDTNVVITDLRQLNEYERLKKLGFTIIKVEASVTKRIQRIEAMGDVFSMEQLTHETEIQAEKCPYDHLIVNNSSLEDLHHQLKLLSKKLQEEGGE